MYLKEYLRYLMNGAKESGDKKKVRRKIEKSGIYQDNPKPTYGNDSVDEKDSTGISLVRSNRPGIVALSVREPIDCSDDKNQAL